MSQTSPIAKIPAPHTIRNRMGALLRELTLLKRLYRLSQAVAEEREAEKRNPAG